MALLDGKQLRDQSTSLDKLQGHSGLVTFTASATMSFEDGSILRRDTADILVARDVVNKEYVDSVAAGLDPKEPVVAIAATGPIALSGDGFAIDGWTVSVGERVLVNSQAGVSVATASNGIYVVAAGTWSRATDSDGSPSTEVSTGNFVFVHEGIDYLHSGWVLTITDAADENNILVGTESQLWVQFSESTDIQAGDGLYEVGTTFNVGVTNGLEIVGGTQVGIATTGVAANTYGGSGQSITFTVNSRGQLTSASTQSISITSTQVSDFTTAVNNEVFDAANFIDGTTIDFQVTAGSTVSAEVIDGSLGTSKLDTNGAGATAGYILSNDGSGNFTWILNDTGDITEVTAGSGLTGGGTTGAITLDVRAENGLTVDGTSDAVELGGTLTKNTTIGGASFDFTLGNAGTILMTASTFDVEADGFVSIDAGTGSAQFLADDTITISASNSVDIVSTGGVYVVGASFSVNGVEIDPTSPTTGYVLTYDGTAFVPQAVAGTGDITEVIAGDGLTGGATQGVATLNVVGGTGINANPDDISINFTQVATNLQGNGLTANGGVLDVNVGTGLVINSDVVEADFTSLATNLQGNGLTANGGVLDVNVNADSLEIVGDVVRLTDTVTGDRTFSGSINIGGNLTVSGTATYINTENLYVEDNIITLNATFSGSPVLDSGIEVNRGSGTYAVMYWDETNDYWKAGLSGSNNYVVTQAGDGLTQNFDTLSVDFTSVAESTQGAGLTASGGVINVGQGNGITVNADDIEVNFTQVADVLAGAGLTGSGVLNVGAGTGIIVNADDIEVDFVSITGNGLTQSGGTINVDYTTVAGNLDGAGLVVVGSELAVNTGLGITISSDAVVADLLVNGGLTFSGNQIEVSVDNTTIQIVGGQLVATTQGDIQGVTAGAGLTGGGSSGFVTLDVNPGDGIEIVGDAVAVNLVNTDSGLEFVTGELQVDLAANSGLTLTGGLQIDSNAAGDGLTFSTGVFAVNVANGLQISGDNVEVAPSIAGAGLTFSGGVLSLNPTASAVPYYGDRNKIPTTTAPNTDDENSGVTITNTPSDYSRVSVYVNGQLQYLGDNTTTADCYFGTQSGSPVSITNIQAGYTLFWNGQDAGFRLTASDRVDIVYEV